MLHFNEDTRVKFPATIQLLRLGYEYQSLKDADIDLNIQNRDYYTFEWKATFTSYPGGELRRVALTVSIVSE